MLEQVLILISVTALMLGAPGPAPVALAATGVTYGLKKGIPLLLGQLTGLLLVILGSSLGLTRAINAYPQLDIVFHFLNAAYIFFIAYTIITAPIDTEPASVYAPGYKVGIVLILVNPGVYATFYAIFSQFLLPVSDTRLAFIVTAVTCWLVAALIDILWLSLGHTLKPLFTNSNQIRIARIVFTLVMIVAVIFSMR